MSYYERRLPHWHPDGKDLFVTWRLHGSLPSNHYLPPSDLTSGKAFVWIDRLLDQARTGPTWLAQPRIAQRGVDAISYGEQTLEHYRLHAYVVMANHVHLLISPSVNPIKVMHSLKGFTAREANKILRRTGMQFWQKESYDHWIRNQQEFVRVQRYIENNPVAVGLTATAEEYPWSSAASKSR